MLYESNLKIKISISIIRTNNNLNKDFNKLINKSSNQIEGKEPDLNDIIKKIGSIKIYLSTFVSITFKNIVNFCK